MEKNLETDQIDSQYFDPDADNDSDITIREYDIVSSPNDFNVLSYFNFIEAGAIKIPEFQRHYVWDIRKASKLIESIIMGLPIPQIFLYEQHKNTFLVIDGQQRLMTIYYFIKGRFPKRDARAKIRQIFDDKGRLEPVDLDDDSSFVKFRLSFKDQNEHPSPYSKLTYDSLEGLQSTFQLRTIRNIMVKQVRPDNDHSSIFELFHRLNTGGVNLSQQEIRMALFDGPFVRKLSNCNLLKNWRSILGGAPDQRQKDVEIIMRMFALAERHEKFTKPLSKFINAYCDKRRNDDDPDGVCEAVFTAFCSAVAALKRKTYLEPKSKRISVPILESLFVAMAQDALRNRDASLFITVTSQQIDRLLSHPKFDEFFTGKTTDAIAVKGRISIAREIVG